jgi:hypothetical protein
MNKYEGIGLLHNQALEQFGQTLVAEFREKGDSALVPRIRQKMILDALQHTLRDASRHLPELAGAKVTMAYIERMRVIQRKLPKSPREAFGDRFPGEAVRDLELLMKAHDSLGGSRIPRSFTAMLAGLEKKYSAEEESVVTQTLLISVAIARHSAEYWRDQANSDDGWTSQLIRLLEDSQPPVRPGSVAGRLIDRIREWFRDNWGDVSSDDAFYGGYGCILGTIGGVPGILLGGLVGTVGGSIFSALG